MANKNVQFFRLGFDSPIKRSTYNSFIKDEHGQFIVDGRIVFANVKEEDLSVHKYIYANGIEYHVDLSAADFLNLVDNDHSNVKAEVLNDKLTFNADLDISGEMIDVVEATDGNYYDKRDCHQEGDEWVPNQGAHNIIDETVIEHGEDKYLKLQLGDDVVYIWSKDLISLDNYYTKDEVNEIVENLDSAIKSYIDTHDEELAENILNVSTVLNDFINSTNEKFEQVDSSIIDIKDELQRQDQILDQLVNDVQDISTTVDDISARLQYGIVSSVTSENEYVNIDPSQGDVKIDIDVVDSSNSTLFPSRGLVTDGYVEEKLDKFNWVEVEDNAEIDPEDIQAGSVTENGPVVLSMPETFNSGSMEITSNNGDVTIN